MEQKASDNKIIILQTDLILKATKFKEYFWKYFNRENMQISQKADIQ